MDLKTIFKTILFYSFSLILFGIPFFLWNTQLPGDTLYTAIDAVNGVGRAVPELIGQVNQGAIHIFINIISWILGIAYIVGLSIWLDENSNEELKDISFNKFKTLVIVLIICNTVWVFGNKLKDIYNDNISFKYQIEQKEQERIMFYDNMWKSFYEKEHIVRMDIETFTNITEIIMTNRKDGENLAWKWSKENQQIPYEEFSYFYRDLSKFVESKRSEYFQLEKNIQQIVQEQNKLLDTFPNNLYNCILNIDKIQYKPGFTSSKTKEIFLSGEENNLLINNN